MSDLPPSHSEEPATQIPRREFWRRTPPALFPALFGLLGLGLAFRFAALLAPLPVPAGIGETLLAISGLAYLFALACYISKLSTRASVIFEDLATPPGRAGGAAMTLCLFLFAAAILPYSAALAQGVMWIGLGAHLLMTAAALLVMSGQPKGLMITPAWHLLFVGFILAALTAVPLGHAALATGILGATMVFALIIYAVSLLQVTRGAVPPPQRPLLVIHLAPVALFTSVAILMQRDLLAVICVVPAVGLAAALLSRTRYLTQAGFSPLWGAFTFPTAAMASALLLASTQNAILGWVALIPLTIGALIIPYIALRIARLWQTGRLADLTGAGIA